MKINLVKIIYIILGFILICGGLNFIQSKLYDVISIFVGAMLVVSILDFKE